jgi:hypothetical protein
MDISKQPRVGRGTRHAGEFAAFRKGKSLASPPDDFMPEDLEEVRHATATLMRKFLGGQGSSSMVWNDLVDEVTSDVLLEIMKKHEQVDPDKWNDIKSHLGGYAYNTAHFVMLLRASRHADAKRLAQGVADGTLVSDGRVDEDGAVFYQVISTNHPTKEMIADRKEIISQSKIMHETLAEAEDAKLQHLRSSTFVAQWQALNASFGWNANVGAVSLDDSYHTIHSIQVTFGGDVSKLADEWGAQKGKVRRRYEEEFKKLFADEESANSFMDDFKNMPAAYQNSTIKALRYQAAANLEWSRSQQSEDEKTA